MTNIFSTVYFQYLDYLLLFFGLFFLGIGFILLYFKRHRCLWMKESPIYVIIFFFLVMGIISWVDLIYYIYNKYPFSSNLHFYIYLIAYISLFELGRRLLFLKKKSSILLYFLFMVLYLININYDIFLMIIALMGSLMSGIGLNLWIKKGRIVSGLKNLTNRLLYIPFFILSICYALILATYLFSNNNFDLHWTRHLVEWSIQLFFGIIVIYHILNVRIKNQFDYQLKDALIRVAKSTLVLLVVVFIIGFFLINGFSRFAWGKDAEKLRTMNSNVVSTINKELVLNLSMADNKTEINKYYLELNEDLIKLKSNRMRVKELTIIFYKDNNFMYGVGTKTNFCNNSFGEVISNPSSLLESAYTEKNTTIGERVVGEKTDKYISVYSPILIEGEVVAVLQTDVIVKTIMEEILKFRLTILAVIFGVMVFIFILAPIRYLYQREKVLLLNYQNILSNINEIICIFDKNGNIIYNNEAMSRLTGYTYEDISDNDSKLFKELIGTNDSQTDLKNIMKQVDENEIYYDEIKITDFNGERIPVFVSVQILEGISTSSLYVLVGMNILEQKKRIQDMQIYFENTLALLSTAVDAKDKYTLRHSSNVAKFAKGIAEKMNFSKEKIEEIEKASILHDIGKIYIPDSILNKEGPLNEHEWEIMKKHSEFGKQILEKAGSTLEHLIPYVYYHHERYDGGGYPTGMKKPPLEIGIVTLADAFDAMSSERSYRKGMSIEEIKKEIFKNSGTQFHPEAVEAFFRYIEGIQSIDELE